MLLEWLEDVRLYEVQGYGAAIRLPDCAAPLLADVAAALVSAAAAADSNHNVFWLSFVQLRIAPQNPKTP